MLNVYNKCCCHFLLLKWRFHSSVNCLKIFKSIYITHYCHYYYSKSFDLFNISYFHFMLIILLLFAFHSAIIKMQTNQRLLRARDSVSTKKQKKKRSTKEQTKENRISKWWEKSILLFKKRRSSKTLIIFAENKYPDNSLLVQTYRRSILIFLLLSDSSFFGEERKCISWFCASALYFHCDMSITHGCIRNSLILLLLLILLSSIWILMDY